MGWKATGQPTVRKQRDRWVVRVDGIDTASGKHRPRQLGTCVPTGARTAASAFAAEGSEGGGRGTVGWVVDQWVAAKTDITEKSQMQNRWAAGHISKALGAIRLDQLDREDIGAWYEQMAAGGVLNKRSITIIRRVLRAACCPGGCTGRGADPAQPSSSGSGAQEGDEDRTTARSMPGTRSRSRSSSPRSSTGAIPAGEGPAISAGNAAQRYGR